MNSASCKLLVGLTFSLAITSGSGCATFQKDPGPVYRFARRDRVKPVEVTTVALKFRDRRPNWERQYHRPLIDPRRKKMGVELLTADNFEPNPIAQFKNQLTTKLAELDSPPESAEVIIKRLHVVVKYATPKSNRGVKTSPSPFSLDNSQTTPIDPVVSQVRRDDAYITAHQKWEQADRTANATGQQSPAEPKYQDFQGSSSGDTVESEIGGLVFLVFLDLLWMTAQVVPSLATESLETARFYANKGPPPAWAKVEPGITCHIEGQVNLRWANGRQTTIPIEVQRTEKYAIDMDSPNYEVTPFLASVISKAVKTVASDAATFAAGRATKDPVVQAGKAIVAP